MSKRMRLTMCLFAGMMCNLLVPAGARPAALVTSFDPDILALEAIAFDPAAGTLFLYHDASGEIREFTIAGVEVLPLIPAAVGAGNDTDLDFTSVALSIAGTIVPAGSLITFNGDAYKIQALNKDTGALLAETPEPLSLQGGFVMPVTGALFGLDWGSELIAELAASDGHVVRSFPIAPPGSPPFGIYFGDIEYCPADRVILVGGTSSSAIRFLALSGSWIGDLDLAGLGIAVDEIGGLALNDVTGHLWIAGRSGIVYELSGVCDSFTIFLDGFETNDTSRWSVTSPLLPEP